MHAKLVVPMHLKLFQTYGLSKLLEFVDQQRFFLSTWLGLVRETFCRELKAIRMVFGLRHIFLFKILFYKTN